MSLTAGVILTGLGIAGVVVSLVMQAVLIRVFSAQRKKMLSDMEAGKY